MAQKEKFHTTKLSRISREDVLNRYNQASVKVGALEQKMMKIIQLKTKEKLL